MNTTYFREVAASKPSVRQGRHRAVVGRCDGPPNLNGRVYPRDVWLKVIADLKGEMTAGRVAGTLDHAEGDRLSRECLLWRVFSVEGDHVVGEFEILPTAEGERLRTLISSGRDVGFSTYGYGASRPATAAERDQWGQSADVMLELRLVAVDAVSDPSVYEARLIRESRGMTDDRNEIVEAFGAEPRPRTDLLASLGVEACDFGDIEASLKEARPSQHQTCPHAAVIAG